MHTALYKIIILLFFLLFPTYSLSQEKNVLRLDSVIRDDEGEKNKIVFIYNKDGKIACETKYAIRKGDPHWQLDSKTEYQYDTRGCVKEQDVYSLGNEASAELWRKFEFSYDASGYLQRGICQAVDANGRVFAFRKWKIVRNAKGQCAVEEVENLDNGTWVTSLTHYSYDHKGRLESVTDSIDNRETKRVSYRYDQRGNLRKMKINSDNEVVTEKYRFKKGHIALLSRTRLINDKMEKSAIHYTYDHRGSLIQKITDEISFGYTYIQSYTYLPTILADTVQGIKDNSEYDRFLPGKNISIPFPLLSLSTFLENERMCRVDFFYSYIK